jgi:hypothetical protein
MKENMMFDLNNGSLLNGGGTAIFNAGLAGKVENVEIEVKRKEESGPFSYSDYTLVVKDSTGASLNGLFSYHKNNDLYDKDKNIANQGYLLGRIQSIAQAVVPEGFVYPDVSDKTCNEIVDILFKIIRDNASGKKVNVFVNYGTKTKPSQYMGLRFFNFIENPNTQKSRLTATGLDMMERIVADTPSTVTTTTATSVDW